MGDIDNRMNSSPQKDMKKDLIIEVILKLGGKRDASDDRIYWLYGHCFILYQETSGSWKIDEL